jgi:hypothetical protein
MKVKITVISDCDDGEPPTSTEKSKRNNEESTRQSKRLKKRNEETENVGVKDVDMIGKPIWVKTTTKKGAKTNQNGWCEATIERINGEGEYVANYNKWKNNSVIIPDLSADTIRFSEPAT